MSGLIDNSTFSDFVVDRHIRTPAFMLLSNDTLCNLFRHSCIHHTMRTDIPT